MNEFIPEVKVHLRRFEGREDILVVVEGDSRDEEPTYLDKLVINELAGFDLDPLKSPHEVEIDDEGTYGGDIVHLRPHTVAFAARPPGSLTNLLFPDGATEITLPCRARSGEFGLSFTLPEGRSLLSLFFPGAPAVPEAARPGPAQPLEVATT